MTLLRIGLVLSAMLAVAAAIPALDIEPDATGRIALLAVVVAVVSSAIAVATLALLLPAWRGGRRASAAIAALQLLAILPSVPAFTVGPDVAPPAAQATAAAGITLGVTAFFLILLGFARRLGSSDAVAQALRDARAEIVEAREQERVAVHHELHDRVGAILTSAIFRADAAQQLLADDPGEARAQLSYSRSELRAALGELRRIVRGLRPSELEQYGLWVALERRAASSSRTIVELTLPADVPVLSPAAELATYRIVAESLANVERHSVGGRASVVIEAGEQFRITITDVGAVTEEWRPGVGLRSIRLQAEELGGSAHLGPTGTGWRVEVEIPLPGLSPSA